MRKWKRYHSIELADSFFQIGLLRRSQLALYERNFERPASPILVYALIVVIPED